MAPKRTPPKGDAAAPAPAEGAAAPAEPRAAAAAASAPVEYEFMGPYLGPIGMMIGLPIVCYGLMAACNEGGCVSASDPFGTWPGLPAGARVWSPRAFAVVFGWMAAHLAVHVAAEGETRKGVVLADGSRLEYKLTGIQNLGAVVALAALTAATGRLELLAWPHEHALELLTASLTLSCLLSLWLYASSFRSPAVPRWALANDTGRRLYDFFLGRERNPRVGGVDLKAFCELVPGLTGWFALDVSAVAHAYLRGDAQAARVAGLVTLFQGIYVADALACESSILTTMDITTDGFGFMLAFGDLTWVPFTYSLQARVAASGAFSAPAPSCPLGEDGACLADAPAAAASPLAFASSLHGTILLCLLNLVGYVVFRGSNSVKDLFRRDPNDPRLRGLQSMPTARGTRLITSGWWGMCRHPNYLGDWIMAWAWCLPLGVSNLVPFFYVIYFGALLFHRCMRDDHFCKQKYGADWDVYKAKVKYALIPYVY